MPRSSHVVLLLSLAACEQTPIAHPQPQLADPPTPPPTVTPPAEPEVAPAEVVTAPTPAPAEAVTVPAVVTPPPAIDTKTPPIDDATMNHHCMSRAGCKWHGERTEPRVVKKP